MEDTKETQEKERANKVGQQITIPFLWEERPGSPKKDWKPRRDPLPPTPLPVKYVASVPFKWEEKPGTPLRCFAHARQPTQPPSVQEPVPENKCLPLPPAYFTKYEDDNDRDSSSFGDDHDYDYDDHDWMSDFEALSINTEEESYPSAPTRQNPYAIPQNDTASYATGNTSLRGASFLEHLFPLYPPKSGFLDKAGNFEENVGCPERKPPTLAEHKKLGSDCGRSGVIRRPLTLGELIMLSRRRSYRRKAVHMKKQNRPKDFTKNNTQGCFHFGANGGGITKRLGKDLLTLKLA